MQFIRVLLIDDDEDDYFITKENLAEIEGVAFRINWFCDPDEALRHLATGEPYDICLLDYRMGRRNGLEVLQEIVATGHRLPIILLTGQEDHDVDQKAVQLGASDYLVKGHTTPVLLERSIRYAIRQKHTEEQLRRQTEFVTAIVETAGALVIVVDTEGRIVRFNRTCEIVSGYTFAEVEGRCFHEFLLQPEEKEGVLNVVRNLADGQFPNLMENNWVTRTGDLRRISWSNTVLCDSEGRVEYLVGIGIDVTEQRKVELALAEARERELEVGANIQKTLLVKRPPENVPGLSFGAVTEAALRVGGDCLDFFTYDEGVVDVLVGDVMGKGVPAALLAAATKSHFQRAARRLAVELFPYGRFPEPEEIVMAVQAVLSPELYRLCSFVTLLYARIDVRRNLLTFVDCGHPSPLHRCLATKQCYLLSGDNVPLGVSLEERYQQKTIPLLPGDLLFFYSDGLIEPVDETGEQFGTDGLMRSLNTYADLPPQELAEQVCADIATFQVEGVDDDRTCVVARIEGVKWQEPLQIFRKEIRSTLVELETLREFLEAALLSVPVARCTEETRYGLTLAVHEAATNILRHAYEGNEQERIQMEVFVFADNVKIRLYDNGKAFANYRDIPPPLFDGSQEGGFGLFLIQSLVSKMEYQRDDLGRNRVTLTRLFD